MNLTDLKKRLSEDKDSLPVECFVSRDELEKLIAVAEAAKDTYPAQHTSLAKALTALESE